MYKNNKIALYGTKVHALINKLIKKWEQEDNVNMPESLKKFLTDNKLVLWKTECSLKYKGLSGRCDAIYYNNNTNEIFILDWKTRMTASKTKKELPFDNILQLNIYRKMMAGLLSRDSVKINLYIIYVHIDSLTFTPLKCPIIKDIFLNMCINKKLLTFDL
ncbi:hypothetical protein GpSGHVEth108 [Glossina pallidipes salivary gland hypertrophy virus]|uniref:PD-(D/E)XK endonuclease-like domain-containing protein n=1 Tax=Glossina hytrovirus (isolate Glossina pallidipes/Ethiopia/Seibersdorf/-) TaxID=379529 RepID=A0A0Y0K7F5_GHVS|nr:hypothetical protein GpSGHVEth108 [Glossina pallidipes salivary gland hypertrophy virus]